MTTAIAPPLTPASKPTLSARLAAEPNPFRVWFPPQSPVRIEYTRELLRVLLPRRDGESAGGVLYGTRAAGAVRVISARPQGSLEPVGIFAARGCGDVFLTEQDIIRLESMDDRLESGGAIALVIAGGHGGFFVRETNGSMQTIKSYQEFPIRAPSPRTTSAAKRLMQVKRLTRVKLVVRVKLVKPLTRLKFVKYIKLLEHPALLKKMRRATLMKLWLLLALAAAGAAILSGHVLLPPPYFSSSRAITVHEENGQLRIAIHPSAQSPGARLQIVDGDERRSIPISPSLTSVVYAPLTRDVRIALVR